MSKPEFLQYGGLAVMEGVMMRSPRYYAVACRAPSGEIVLHQDEVPGGGVYGKPWYKVPILRGALAIWDMLLLGIQALNFSAKVQLGEVKPAPPEGWEARDGAGEGAKRGVTSPEGSEVVSLKPGADSFGTKAAIGGALVAGLALAVLLFVVGPTWIAEAFRFLGVRGSVALNWIEGLVKVIVFLGYIGLLGLVKDIREVYKYHGAEHKTINTYESGEELTVENVRRHSMIHRRCGTTFLLYVVVISIFLFSFFSDHSMAYKLVSRVVLLPVVAGIAYEIIRFSGSSDSRVIQWLFGPGLLLQKLTTREPDDQQIEVAIE
ncbi:MAG: DUF1385 domain-containing protein, partial [Fimbriimonadales bacterium]|nr:DUF1385 domain-containing protein [Fimbriimonadales bacterium]